MDGAWRRPWQRRGPPLVALACAAVGLLGFLSARADLKKAARARAEIAELLEVAHVISSLKRPLPSSLASLAANDPCIGETCANLCATSLDPFGRPWIFEVTGRSSFRIRCLGADGLPGGTGADADLSSDDP